MMAGGYKRSESAAELAAHMIAMRLGDMARARYGSIEGWIHIRFDLLLRGQHGAEPLFIRVQYVQTMRYFIGPELDLGRMPDQQLRWQAGHARQLSCQMMCYRQRVSSNLSILRVGKFVAGASHRTVF